MLGTTPRTLRYYEEESLVTAKRTARGTRLYSDSDIARFRGVLHLAEMGLPISAIKELAHAREQYKTGAESSQAVNALLDAIESEVNNTIASLRRLKSQLGKASGVVEKCSECKNKPTRKDCPACPMNDGVKRSDILALIWEQADEKS